MEKQIIEKLRKLLALANDRAATEAEAQAAMGKVQQLLAAHKLSMSDLETSDNEEVGRDGIHIGRKSWQFFLYAAAAKVCFSMALQSGQSVMIVGRLSDVAAAKCLGEYLCSTGLKMLKAASLSGKAQSNSWKLGYSHRIWERAHDIVRKARENKVQDSVTGKEMILHPLYSRAEKEVSTYLASQGIRLRGSSSRSTVSSRDAYASGRESGNSVHLGTNVISGGGSGVLGIGYKG